MRSFRRLFAAIPVAVLLVAMFAVPALADPRDFSVVNNTSFVITHVYVATSDSSDWGDDILGRDVLYPAESVPVTFNRRDSGTSCQWDVSITGQSGQQGVMYKVDLCSTTTVTFTDSGNS